MFFVDVYEDSASYSAKPRARAKIEVQTWSVELDFDIKSSTSTQIRSTISPECEREAQFQSKIVDVYEDSASYSSKPRAGAKIELRTSSVELDFNTKSSTSTQIRSTISPDCERGAQFQCKIVDVYKDSASDSSKP